MNVRLLLACGLALVALGVGVAVVTALSGREGSRPKAPVRLTGPAMPAGLRAFDFTLDDQDGRPVHLAASRGRVVVLTFVHSRCTSTCPVTLQTIRGALDDLTDAGVDRGDVDVLALSVDPREDTRRNVRRFLATQHAGGFTRYLVGPRPRMLPIWKRYGIAPQGHGAKEEHTAFVMLVDRRGVLRVGFPSHQMTPEDLANDLQVLLAERAAA